MCEKHFNVTGKHFPPLRIRKLIGNNFSLSEQKEHLIAKMRSKTIFLVFVCTLCMASAELQGPPSDSGDLKYSYKDRKSNSIDDEDSNSDTKKNDDATVDKATEPSDKNTLESLLAEDFSYQGSAIKIIKAPDFTQEKEAQKMTEMLSTLVNSHAKLIKKLEDEIEEMDGSIASLGEQPEQVQTQEEIELEMLYESAMKILNRTRSDKTEGFALLKQASDKGHPKAQAKIAWAQLMGNHVEMDFNAARETFLNLADTGLPAAHMVDTFHTLFRLFLQKILSNFLFEDNNLMTDNSFTITGFGFYVRRRNWL